MITILFTTISLSLGLPTGLLSSLCYVESKHKINVIHKDDGSEDSLGICQIHYTTAKELGFKGSVKDLMKPENNILYAGLYLKKQIKRYKSIRRGVIAYNRGNAIFLISTSYQDKVYRQWRKHYNVQTR
jgi:soluble lytic murein transglycosylase-like protein